jgi:hypothetical protein
LEDAFPCKAYSKKLAATENATTNDGHRMARIVTFCDLARSAVPRLVDASRWLVGSWGVRMTPSQTLR